jgi:hypothetical protein
VFGAMVYGGGWEMFFATTLAFKGLKVAIVEKKSKKNPFHVNKKLHHVLRCCCKKKKWCKTWFP